MTFLSLHNEPEPRLSRKGGGFRLLCGDFLLPNPAPYPDNRKTVCVGYPAMTRGALSTISRSILIFEENEKIRTLLFREKVRIFFVWCG